MWWVEWLYARHKTKVCCSAEIVMKGSWGGRGERKRVKTKAAHIQTSAVVVEGEPLLVGCRSSFDQRKKVIISLFHGIQEMAKSFRLPRPSLLSQA